MGLATRERPGGATPEVSDPDPRQSLLGAALAFGARDPTQLKAERDVIQHRTVEQQRALERDGDPTSIRDVVANDLTAETQLAARRKERGKGENEGALAGAIRTEQRECLPLFDADARDANDLASAARHDEIRGFDDRHD